MSVTDRDLAVDRKLSQVCGVVPLLRLVTPTNVPEAKERFFRGEDLEFEYRDLPDLDEVRSQVAEVSPEEVDDPLIASMVEGLIKEVNLRIDMLASRGTDDFFLASVEMFGSVGDEVVKTAHEILENGYAPPEGSRVSAEEFANAARKEIDVYRQDFPEMTTQVHVSETISGVMVETGDLYIGKDTRIAEDRVLPLLQHEVGTHIVTYENGRAQPLHMLALGLAGYDELQEAMGVLAEYLVGGLDMSRLRVLAYRVIAAKLRSEQASFREAYRELSELGCSKGIAFRTVMRAYRGGGMTKDAIYLRGLIRLLEHLAKIEDTDLAPFYVGKVSFEAIPLARQLLERSALVAPPLTPRYLKTDGAAARFRRIREGLTVLELGAAA
jgi:uncharacterized protein (TIGR02421 family)